MVFNGLFEQTKEGNRIEHQGEICKVGEVAERIEIQQVKPISIGNQHMLYVGETNVQAYPVLQNQIKKIV